MYTLFGVLALFVAASINCSPLDANNLLRAEWQQFKSAYGKKYENHDTEEFRLRVYMENKLKIDEHNKLADTGLKSYRLGMNEFGDLQEHEFLQARTGLKVSSKMLKKSTIEIPKAVDLPKSIDYREKGYVTPVKDQGHCGSCWAFSATGAIEGQHFRKTGKLVSLSEQNLVDCSFETGNYGCEGGFSDKAFVYTKINGGIDTEESYPYEGREGECRYKKQNVGATVKGLYGISQGNETELAAVITAIGPVSVAVQVKSSFRFYISGIYNERNCSNKFDDLNHAILAVGFGENDKGEKYWIVKNSWGTNWGEKGYILMSRDKNNQCGIATDASIPIV